MTEWLVRRFVTKDYQEHENPKVRVAYGKFAGIVGIVCNVLLCLGKGLAGLLSESVSIVADAVNNLSDASSNVISLLGFKLAGKPADSEHPYGHGRYEYLSGLLVAMLIVVIGVELVGKAPMEKIANPEPTDFSWVVVGILVASILVKLWMMLFNRTIGRRIGSTTLEATAVDSRNDVVTTATVLAALLVSHYTGFDLDKVGQVLLWVRSSCRAVSAWYARRSTRCWAVLLRLRRSSTSVPRLWAIPVCWGPTTSWCTTTARAASSRACTWRWPPRPTSSRATTCSTTSSRISCATTVW